MSTNDFGTPQGGFMPPAAPSQQPAEDKGKGKGKRSRSRRPKDMNKPRSGARVALMLAAFFAVLLAAAVFFNGAASEVGGLYAAQAKTNLSAFDALTPDDLTAVEVPEGFFATEDGTESGAATAQAGFFVGSSPEEAISKVFEGAEGEVLDVVLRYPVSQGEMINRRQLTLATEVRKTLGGIEDNERIISIEAQVANAAAGAIRPGDIVDVVVASSSYELARTILTGIEVADVQVNQASLESIYTAQMDDPTVSTDALLPADPLPGLYTLVVPAEKVNEVAVAGESATIWLVVRTENALEVEVDAPASLLETLCPGDLPGMGGLVEIGDEEGAETPIELPRACVEALIDLEEGANPTFNPEEDIQYVEGE